ncbi:hypothetical protein [Corynebacterium matruchotii]|jgi:conserved domain protein|uniref:hypothetical protein n=1 Tax=Corynebacterium matruchotii TaxID=43768 RepID=UPI0028E57685|nr:hypothetical protein [Corynebacterium matruchotii]
MKLANIFLYCGYVGLALSSVFYLIDKQYVFAAVTFFILGLFLLHSLFSRKSTFDSDVSGEIPDPAIIKQYRIDHPGTSIPEAVNAIMKSRNDGAQV